MFLTEINPASALIESSKIIVVCLFVYAHSWKSQRCGVVISLSFMLKSWTGRTSRDFLIREQLYTHRAVWQLQGKITESAVYESVVTSLHNFMHSIFMFILFLTFFNLINIMSNALACTQTSINSCKYR